MTDRRMHIGPILGTVAHHGFELAAGVGLVFQPYFGLEGAALAWGVSLPVWTVLALRKDKDGSLPAVSQQEQEPAGTEPPEAGAPRRASRPVIDAILAFLAGMSLAGALLHFKLWPVARRPAGRWYGVPLLTEAEGLTECQLPVYNAILYGWVVASVGAVLRGTPPGARRWAVPGLLAAIPLSVSARHHFKWLGAQARDNPAWWNRAGRTA